MRDFEPNLLFNLGGHAMNLPEIKTIDNSAGLRIEIEGGSVGYYPQRRVLHACKREDVFRFSC